MSLLSWDDLEDDSPVKDATNKDIALKAAESIKNLDATEGEKELAEQGAAIARNKALKESGLVPPGSSDQPLFNPGAQYSAEQLKGMNMNAWNKAKDIVAKMDAELQSGGRVGVDEKYLLNCKADLNQLVPFKYNWSWSLYLSSCENHWMPGELSLERSAAALNDNPKGSPKRFLARWYYNLCGRKKDFNNTMLLNIYRIITNPECRQYILRLAFENSTLDHVQTDVNDAFNPLHLIAGGEDVSKGQWGIDSYSFQNRRVALLNATKNIRNFEFNTEGVSNIGTFIEELLYAFAYGNWIQNIVPSYQLLKSLRNEGICPELQMLITKQLKDIQYQTAFIKLFLEGVVDENPKALTDDSHARIQNTFKKFFNCEYDLAGTLGNTDTETLDVTNLVKFYSAQMMKTVGIDVNTSGLVNNENTWYVELIDSLQPTVNHEAGLSGNGGALDW